MCLEGHSAPIKGHSNRTCNLPGCNASSFTPTRFPSIIAEWLCWKETGLNNVALKHSDVNFREMRIHGSLRIARPVYCPSLLSLFHSPSTPCNVVQFSSVKVYLSDVVNASLPVSATLRDNVPVWPLTTWPAEVQLQCCLSPPGG